LSARDPHDFVERPEKLVYVMTYLNKYLAFDGLELQQQGASALGRNERSDFRRMLSGRTCRLLARCQMRVRNAIDHLKKSAMYLKKIGYGIRHSQKQHTDSGNECRQDK
jgi:hypothetical protein